MKIMVLILVMISSISFSDTQDIKNTSSKNNSEEFIDPIEVTPHFPSGNKSFHKFLTRNLKWPNAIDDTQGTVWLSFTVGKQGDVNNVKILKGLAPEFDQEAIRVAKLFPRWIPAKSNGKSVSSNYNIPIRFFRE